MVNYPLTTVTGDNRKSRKNHRSIVFKYYKKISKEFIYKIVTTNKIKILWSFRSFMAVPDFMIINYFRFMDFYV